MDTSEYLMNKKYGFIFFFKRDGVGVGLFDSIYDEIIGQKLDKESWTSLKSPSYIVNKSSSKVH